MNTFERVMNPDDPMTDGRARVAAFRQARIDRLTAAAQSAPREMAAFALELLHNAQASLRAAAPRPAPEQAAGPSL